MTTQQLSFTPRDMKPQSPRALLEDALVWIHDNPAAWQMLVEYAAIDANQRGRVRVKRYIEDLRDAAVATRRDGNRYKLPNAFSPVFGRILAAWYPQLADYIPTHRSKVDGLTIPPCPPYLRSL